jgi:TRAP-type mannitol/chloroaromatic compound transport system permease small subunit
MVRFLDRGAAFLGGIVEYAGRLTAWLTLGLTLLVAGNVLLRYAFAYGSVASQELEWHVLAVISLLGISYTLAHGEHVRVDILYHRYSPRARIWLELVTAVVVMVPMSAYIAWLSVQFVGQSYSMAEISPDPGGLTHRWLLKGFITLGFSLLAVQGLAIAMRSLADLLAWRHGS